MIEMAKSKTKADPFAGEKFRLVNRESGSGDQTPPPATAPVHDRSKDYQMSDVTRARLIADKETTPLVDGISKWKDFVTGDIYHLRQHPGGYEEWIPMQGRKPKRPKKLPPIDKAHKDGEALFDPSQFTVRQRNSFAGQ